MYHGLVWLIIGIIHDPDRVIVHYFVNGQGRRSFFKSSINNHGCDVCVGDWLTFK